jgi:hypothetical protein
MIRSKIAMGSLWTVLVLALHVWPGMIGPVHAQGTRKDDIVFNSRGVPLAGASVRVCAMPATGQSCTPLAQIYSDSGLTQALANPTTTDGMGNYFFYAAPGRYEIEISGPGITDKQIPNVLLPNDPSSPTFTGGVSAFSLNLSGNLSVSGNTTVIGSLASGTLNLTNQGTPPGAANLGTVNLYAKTADKRLYYKDDSGTEIGPISTGGSGAQLNVTNTFTAPQNFDGDLHTKGPNPYYDLTRFGLYAGIGGAITCSTTASSTTATCTSAGDFAPGQGIAIPTAGAAANFSPWGVATITNYSRSSNVATLSYTGPTFGAGQTITVAGLADATFNGTFTVTANDGDYGHITMANTGSNVGPTAGSGTATLTSAQVVVTSQGILNGSTTYAYKVVLRGYHGELSVASSAGSITTGAATLGVNIVTLSGCTRTSGTTTCTSTAAHNFQAGVMTDVEGVSDGAFNGVHRIIATPTGTTFTFLQSSQVNTTGATGGTAKVVAKNLVQWNMQEYANIQTIVYRSINGGAYSIAGIVEGMDGSFVDWGLGAPPAPPGVPSTPASATTNGILSTTITAISGTTFTLAAAATATATSVSSLHDNTPAMLAGCAALGTNGNGTLYIPVTNPPTAVPFNSPVDLYHFCPVNQVLIAVGSVLTLNDPIIMHRAGTTIKGVSPSAAVPNFGVGFTTLINGNAYPYIYYVPGSFGPNMLENLYFLPSHAYQSAFVEDADAGGGGVVNTQYNNDYFVGNSGGEMPGIIRGGFTKFFDKGLFAVQGAWGVPESLEIDNQNSLGICASCTVPTYIMKMDRITFQQHGISWDDWGIPISSIEGYLTVNDSLMESGYTPLLMVNTGGGGTTTLTQIEFNRSSYADFLSGSSTPMFLMGTGGVGAFVSNFTYCGSGNQPLFEGPVGGVEVKQGYAAGCSLLGTSSAIVTNLQGASGNSYRGYQSIPVQASGTGQFYYGMATPAAPTLALSSGGSVPLGAHNYQIAALDANGNQTVLGPAASVTATSGNQTVTVTPPALPAGAIGYITYRDGSKAAYGICASYSVGVAVFVDTAGFTCGNSPQLVSTAAATSLSSTGLVAPQLQLVGGSSDTLTGNFSAARAQSFPDVSGIVPVSGYLNTAYDNFNRANGAIGSNWTANVGGFNVASNALVGTGTSNIAYFSAAGYSFSNAQFAQVQVLTLNGTSDYVGVDVLLSTSNSGYTCVENSASLLLQKLTAGAGATLASSATAGAPGDILRLEAAPGGVLTCSRNSGGTITSITATDTTFTAGSPAIEQFGSTATMDNWSGGNLHPIGQLDIEQDWARTQHFGQGVAIGTEPLSASPRAEQNIFLPGALSSTWTGSTWTSDKAITVTRVQIQAKTAPSGCSTNAVVRLTDGTTPINVTIAAAANDSGSIAQNYAAAASLQLLVQTAAAGCTTSPADANVVVQYRMQ